MLHAFAPLRGLSRWVSSANGGDLYNTSSGTDGREVHRFDPA
jgi:hypothetical protein